MKARVPLALLALHLLCFAPNKARAQTLPATVKIKADLMHINGAESQAVFSGKVLVTRGKDTLRCRSLTVTYDDKGQVQSFVAQGTVVMVRGTRRIRSERAELDNAANLITLTGDPVLEEGHNRIHGERVRYDLLADEVEVERVRATLDPKGAPGLEGTKP